VPDISLILPTRGRPALARRFLDSVARTADVPEQLEVVLYVDEDDPPSHAISHPDFDIVKLVRPRARMGAITQACYQATTGRYVMLVNDDVVCQTLAWDTAVLARLESYPDDIALVWGNDLFRGNRLPSHPILSRAACEIIGRVCPEQYHRDYIDTHILDVFRTLAALGHERMCYLPHVIFEHLHPEAGKAPLDTTCMKNHRTSDELTYVAWADERQLAAARLARHIEHYAACASIRLRAAQPSVVQTPRVMVGAS
jgi:hypothetical protein